MGFETEDCDDTSSKLNSFIIADYNNLPVRDKIISIEKTLYEAILWMFKNDEELTLPKHNQELSTLLTTSCFNNIIDDKLKKKIQFIYKTSLFARTGKKITDEQAQLCKLNFDDFLVWFCNRYCPEEVDTVVSDVKQQSNNETSSTKPLTEQQTRKIYIDIYLEDAGWIEGQNWINEYPLKGMPNVAGVGYADYVLQDDNGEVLAVIEAKKTCVNVEKGRIQGKLYCDLIEKKQSFRPVLFLSNGYEHRIVDNTYPERKVAAFYSKRDLQRLIRTQRIREPLNKVVVDKEISGRYYQIQAVKAVCEAFENNHRKALLVMATGSGKTRTVISLAKVLREKAWVNNILFLADRNSLVEQAMRSFVNLYQDLSCSNLCKKDFDPSCHCVFSTYQSMISKIDTLKEKNEKYFTCGHFDLVICDEAHRSIYNKYKDIFTYFDAPLVGLTATPKDEIDKNTYEIFELENGVPTYGYELAQAVKDGFLVGYLSAETSTKFLSEGIVYDELSDEEKREFENMFADEDGEIPELISSSALNEWLFNEDTIAEVLNVLMTQGLKIDFGQKVGKTIIFAKNHRHAEKILEVFNKKYPHLSGFATVIDNYINYVQSEIDKFSVANKLPQIAISVDMLDTGIDVPSILNLVFFKKVLSKAKFWQMIGRGTRLCPELIDGKDKKNFYIFDFCGNFEFFRMNTERPSANVVALQCAIFCLLFQIAFKLQDANYQTQELKDFRNKIVDYLLEKVNELDLDNFAVRQHREIVDKYSERTNYEIISLEDTQDVKDELAPLIQPDFDDAKALRFDALIYGIELAYLAGKNNKRSKRRLKQACIELTHIANVPEISACLDLIEKVANTDFVDDAGVNDFENIRKTLRDLIKYIPTDRKIFDTNFDDDVLDINWEDADLDDSALERYRDKVQYYIFNQDNEVIKKIKNNVPVTKKDIDSLENIFWDELGSKEEYNEEYGDKPLGTFVRELVGLDMNAAKAQFAKYIDRESLNTDQIYFLDQIIEYVISNGVMLNLSVLQDRPFIDHGSVVDLFPDQAVWAKILKAIESINKNTAA